MTTTTMQVAKERQLDWLLEEVLGARRGAAVRTPPRAIPWLAAAVALFAVGAALGVAWLRAADERSMAQEPDQTIPWHECHGAGGIDEVPADASALRCFDFDDAACARLAAKASTLPRLTHLDLSGMDVDARGVSRSLPITDAGVRALAPFTGLRWLSLEQCHQMQGEGLQVLEAMPRLEHLDLTYSGVASPAIERLDRLPSLRTLVLSHCMDFHGRSLAAVARLPGLRRLELQACTTLAAKDVLPLVQLKELRWLDLRDCQGRFRGQTVSGFSTGGEEPPPPPVQDGIGITDAVVAALAALPLETLLLGGSESLTDAIGESLAKMTTLRRLDLSHLPKLSDRTLSILPASLESLSLRNSYQLRAVLLPPLRGLRSLDATGLSLSATDVQQLLAGRSIEQLSLGAITLPNDLFIETMEGGAAGVLAAAKSLRRLRLHGFSWLDPAAMLRIAALANLQELDLNASTKVTDDVVGALAGCRSLQSLKLTWCVRITGASLADLANVPLRELNLYGTKCDPVRVRELAAQHWPGCTITLPNGQRFRTP